MTNIQRIKKEWRRDARKSFVTTAGHILEKGLYVAMIIAGMWLFSWLLYFAFI